MSQDDDAAAGQTPGDLPVSSYLKYLPAVLQEGPFLGPFLAGFEAVLTGGPGMAGASTGLVGPNSATDLETVLRQIHLYFDPKHTPADFLPWLAGWVALSLRDDWSEATKRTIIANAVSLYRLRGTKEGIKQAIEAAQPGVKASVAVSKSDSPYHFEVEIELNFGTARKEDYLRAIRTIESTIDQQKPAHTYYTLIVYVPKLQIFEEEIKGRGIWLTKTLQLGSDPVLPPSK